MKAITLFHIVVLLVCSTQAAEIVGGPVAVVNDVPITRSEVLLHMKSKTWFSQTVTSQPELLQEQQEERALQELIDRTLILEEFEQLGAAIVPSIVDEAENRFIRDRYDGDREAFLQALEDSEEMSLKRLRQLLMESIIIRTMRARHSG
ncbi:MAG: SurA N-terminal domain-containing protein, partial [Verrucomicrobiota bacterium]